MKGHVTPTHLPGAKRCPQPCTCSFPLSQSEQVGRDRVWVVPEVTNSIERMPAQAVLLNLAFLAPIPDDSEYGNDAALCLRNFLQV